MGCEKASTWLHMWCGRGPWCGRTPCVYVEDSASSHHIVDSFVQCPVSHMWNFTPPIARPLTKPPYPLPRSLATARQHPASCTHHRHVPCAPPVSPSLVIPHSPEHAPRPCTPMDPNYPDALPLITCSSISTPRRVVRSFKICASSRP